MDQCIVENSDDVAAQPKNPAMSDAMNIKAMWLVGRKSAAGPLASQMTSPDTPAPPITAADQPIVTAAIIGMSA